MKAHSKNRFYRVSIAGLMAGLLVFGFGITAQAKTVELNFSHHLPPISPVAKALESWAKKVETDTNGQIKITVFPSGTLAKGREAYGATASGVCDICFVNNVYERNKWALNQVVNLDALPIPSNEKGIELWDKLWEKFPMMKAELKDVQVIAHTINPPASIHTQKEVRVPADVKGMKIAAFGAKIKILEKAGAAPVGIGANDWYLSLEKGVIEGTFAPIHLLVERGIEGLTPYHLDVGMGQGGNYILMNSAKYNKLPDDVKATLDNMYDWTNKTVFTALNKIADESWEKCRKAGQTVIEPTPAEKKMWFDAAQPVAMFWIKQSSKKGPAKEIFEYAKQLLAEMK